MAKKLSEIFTPEPDVDLDAPTLSEPKPAAAAPTRNYVSAEEAHEYWKSGRTPEEAAEMMAQFSDDQGFFLPA